jgi:hypothetical protein
MGTKKTETKTVSKSKEVIERLLKNRGFKKHEIISENENQLIVAFGYLKHNHSELICYDLKTKKTETIIVDGEATFDLFLVKVKEKFDYK